MGLGLLCMGCCVWVCSVWFMGKCRGCDFLWMGCLAKRLGRKRARRAPSVCCG
ncbi:hypothetical protein NC651_003174 [Populus alba x Populus x berolinensis]|nr:hypothetical protein NC651_003174 [Populus alba x Populus x berolinensis]